MNNGTKLMFFVAIGVLGLFFIIEVIRIARYLSISKRMTNTVKKFERLNPISTKRILFVGDSTGYGTGTSHERYSIVGRMGADFPDAYIENQSKTGLTLSQACQILRGKADAKQSVPFDVIIIMVGGINLTYCMPLLFVRRSLQTAVEYSKRCGHQTIIISPNNTGLAPLYRFPVSHIYKKRAKQFDTLYKDIARETKVHHISLFQEHSDQLSTRNLFSLDRTHPNDEGYGIWYNQIKQTIKMVLIHHDGNTT